MTTPGEVQALEARMADLLGQQQRVFAEEARQQQAAFAEEARRHQAALAAEIAELAGGTRALAKRARELAEAGELRLACHLVELATQAAPEDRDAHAQRAWIYLRRREGELSLMARGIYRSAAEDSQSIAGTVATERAGGRPA